MGPYTNMRILAVVVMLSFAVIVPTEACPCACSVHQVDCYGRNLQEIPPDIPDTVVHVDLQNNLIETIHPERLSRLVNMETLILRGNKLTRLDSETFVNMTILKRLDLSNNDIEDVDPDAFNGLSSLQVLDFDNNKIANVTGRFVNVPSIERLSLRYNRISELNNASLSGLVKLQYLALDWNGITSISDTAFTKLELLSYLVLGGNPIKNADKLWGGLHKLSFLDLSGCQLSAIPKGLPWSLSVLRLGNNSIKVITSSDLRAQRYLGVLSVNDNMLTEIQYGAFSYSPHLGQIDVSGNKLTQLPDTIPAYVQSFKANNNQIKRIFQNNFDHDSTMTQLHLAENHISDLAANTFSRLKKLQVLALDNNEIRVLYHMTFMGLRSVRFLVLDHNPLREIQFRALAGLAKLQHFSLSAVESNDTKIEGNIFRDTPSLYALDLHESPSIVNILLNTKEMLWAISSVAHMNIDGNNLEYIPTDVITALPKLRVLKATDNPWRCNHNLRPLRAWMEKSWRVFKEVQKMICEHPPWLKGKPILDISLADFTMPTTLPTTTTTTMTTTTPTTTTTTKTITPESLLNTTKTSHFFTSPFPTTDFIKPKYNNTSRKTNPAPFTSSTQKAPSTTSTASRSFSRQYTSPSKSTRQPKSTSPSTPSNTKIIPTNPTKSTGTTRKTTQTKKPSQRPQSTTQTTRIRDSSSAKQKPTTSARNIPPSVSTKKIPTSTRIYPTTIKPTFKTTSNTKRSTPRVKYTKTAQVSSTLTQKTTRNLESKTTSEKIRPTALPPTTTRKIISPSPSTTTPKTQYKTSPTNTHNKSQPPTPAIPATDYPTKLSVATSTKIITTYSSKKMSTKTGRRNTITKITASPDTTSAQIPAGNGRYLSSVSSPDTSDDKGLIIGVSCGLVVLALFIVIIIIMVRYRKARRKVSFVEDVSYGARQEEASDTVCIMNHIHDLNHEEDGMKQDNVISPYNSIQSQNSQKKDPKSMAPGEPSGGSGGKANQNTRKISNNSKNSLGCISYSKGDGDADLLMHSWS